MSTVEKGIPPEALLRGQQEVLEMVARNAPLSESLSAIAAFAERTIPDMMASILYFDPKQGKLKRGGYGKLPSSFADIVDGMVPGPTMGSCGTCAYLGERVISEDVFQDPLWNEFHGLCNAYNIRSAWSSPLMSSRGDGVLGVLGMYYPFTHAPDAADLELIDHFTHLATIAAQRHRDDEEQRYRSLHDALTGLGNRYQLEQQGAQLFEGSVNAGTPLSVVFIDFDNFKTCNDSFGHVKGDELLRTIGQAMRDALQPSELLIRFGGDEFIGIFAESVDEVQRRLDVLRSQLAQGVTVDGMAVQLAFSGGLVGRHDGHADMNQLILEADDATREAKDVGGDRVLLVDARDSARRVQRREIRQALSDMLGRKQGLLNPHLQPIVDMATGQVKGFESLFRLNDPRAAKVPVDQCIRIAEQTGQIHGLGLEMLRFAFEVITENQTIMRGRQINVNLSVLQLLRPDFLSQLEAMLEEHPSAASQICLEVTESQWLDSDGPAKIVLDRLRSHGFGLALDDFGTGYASLRYLQSLPFTSIKIDRSFVNAVDTGGQGAALCRALLSMAEACGLGTVAEGVETASQQSTLREMGYRFGQGYLWSKPLAAKDALAWLASREVTAPA